MASCEVRSPLSTSLSGVSSVAASAYQMESESSHNSSSSHSTSTTSVAVNAQTPSRDDVKPKLTMTSSPRPRTLALSAPEPSKPTPTPNAAISFPAHYTSSSTYQDDRPLPLNVPGPSRTTSSTASRNAFSSSSKDGSVNGSRSQTSSQVFPHLTDLAAHYGIPQFFPPAPRTTPPRRQESVTESSNQSDSDLAPDHNLLCSNYLAMLSSKSDGNQVSEVFPSSEEEAVNAVLGVLGGSFPSFPTPSYGDFLTSPYDDSPFDEPLTTPAMGSADMDLLTSPLLDYNDTSPDLALFSDMSFFDVPMSEVQKPEQPIIPFNMDDLYPMTPMTPALDSSSLYPSPRQPSHQAMPAPSRRKSSATGTRKNITPETLVPIDAPTQPRKYQTPSATSRKELPAVFAKKRTRSQAFADEEDELEEGPLPPNASEKEQIEWKRRQNTLAARKSRKRKLQHQLELEETVQSLTAERDMWRTRAITFRDMLVNNGVNIPPFADA